MNAPVDIRGVTLRTPRLLLRPWRLDDLDDLYAYASVEGVGAMAGWSAHRNKVESREILERFIAGRATFALEHHSRVVGSVGIERYNEDRYPEFGELRCRELGFVLARDLWGQGLMPEAVSAVIRWLFEDERMDLLVCGHFRSNRQSARVQEKCGFWHYDYGQRVTSAGTVEEDEGRVLWRADWLATREEDA